MSADHPLLRTVLVVFAVWSVAVLVAVEAGLGGRWSLHPDAPPDPSQLPRVQLLSGGSRVGDFQEYASVVERPLFREDRRPAPDPAQAAAPVEQAPPAPLEVTVTSIVLAGDRQLAILSDAKGERRQAVRLGAALEGELAAWRLVELKPRLAVFEGPGGRREVELRVFDGQGGEPPTPVQAPPAPAAQAQPDGQPLDAGEVKQDPSRPQGGAVIEPDSPEARAEAIRRRIEERRRQMREEAERARAERGQ